MKDVQSLFNYLVMATIYSIPDDVLLNSDLFPSIEMGGLSKTSKHFGRKLYRPYLERKSYLLDRLKGHIKEHVFEINSNKLMLESIPKSRRVSTVA
jgi:hypothetical protein